MNITDFVVNHSKGIYNRLLHFVYMHIYIPYKAYSIRKKDKITVLFILAELGAWKTEALYRAMSKHPRFNPIIGITRSMEVRGSKDKLVQYLIEKNYGYVDLDLPEKSIDKINPDVKFYYKPYEASFLEKHRFMRHLKSLTCHIHYAFNQGDSYYAYYHPITRWCWFTFVENKYVLEARKRIEGLYNKNVVVTGYPVQDQLNLPLDQYDNPWKRQSTQKKRIIYAPHHSFKGTNGDGVQYATFLEYGDYILLLAEKYQNIIQWAFKPHPSLFKKLCDIWGEERTKVYYNKWNTLENCQLELGVYDGLFMHSDAMIHDCSSFIVEYHYTHNPVLFLLNDTNRDHCEGQGEFGIEAYKAHYQAHNCEDIENFILQVIHEDDPMKEIRKNFYNKYLTPPHGLKACDNIINCILGR